MNFLGSQMIPIVMLDIEIVKFKNRKKYLNTTVSQEESARELEAQPQMCHS